MNLIDLLERLGIETKRKSSTNGGEYGSPCPVCAGEDRFIIQPGKDRYWCRRCNARGDSIQFCRDFLDMSFVEACRYLNISKPASNFPKIQKKKPRFYPRREPDPKWQIQAAKYVEWTHHNLISQSDVLSLIMNERGLTYQTLCKFMLGYSYNKLERYNDFYRSRESWGLPTKYNEKGRLSRVWLPSGLVVPCFDHDGTLLKIKTRRKNWFPEDEFPKYVEITGSSNQPFICGDISYLPTIIVEAELDAIKIYQDAENLCACVATGGASKKPDLETHLKLMKAPLLLFALDDDDAGTGAYKFWRTTYANLRPWPAPFAKSPADASKVGADIKNWVLQGIQHYADI